MRIVFIGAIDFSHHCLDTLICQEAKIVGVFTVPKEDAKNISDYADLEPLAFSANIPCHQVADINSQESIEKIINLKPDFIFVFGWSRLLSKQLLNIPRFGCIGTHPALLPKNRGRHPIIWTLVEGLEEGGLTFFFLDEGIDSGPVLWQESFKISMEDDAGTLYQKIKRLASKAFLEFLPPLQKGIMPCRIQDHKEATYWRKRSQKDGEINWYRPSLEIYNLVRALTRPYPGAHTYFDDQKIKVWKVVLPQYHDISLEDIEPGVIFCCDENTLYVRTQDNFIQLINYTAKNLPKFRAGDRLGVLDENTCIVSAS